MVWVGRDLLDHAVPAACCGQGPLPPDQVAQSPLHPGLSGSIKDVQSSDCVDILSCRRPAVAMK